MSIGDEDTADTIPTEKVSEPVVATSFDETGIKIGAITHRGIVRFVNEDQYAVMRRTRIGEVLATSLPNADLAQGREQSWLLAVADGLGGQVSGEVASATAIRTVMNLAIRLSSWIMRPDEGLRDDLNERAERYSQAIQRELQNQARNAPELAGMATTLTGAYIYGNKAMIVNVGDSRSYLIRSNTINQVTQDHTVAEHLKSKGAPPPSKNSYRNVLTRCFSTAGQTIAIDMFYVDLRPGDQILLCSDGLTKMLDDQEILRIADRYKSTKQACEELVIEALISGGRDNITLVLARIS